MFQAKSELLDKVLKLLSLSEKNYATVKPNDCNDQKTVAVKRKVKQEPKEDGNYSPEAKRIKVEDDDDEHFPRNLGNMCWQPD